MTDPSAIKPSPEQVKQWWRDAQACKDPDLVCWVNYVAAQAAQWGANKQLETLPDD